MCERAREIRSKNKNERLLSIRKLTDLSGNYSEIGKTLGYWKKERRNELGKVNGTETKEKRVKVMGEEEKKKKKEEGKETMEGKGYL